ncbi:MAG: D-2-hydroxyacid dehydrogenase [Anaerolineae bacterium]
MPDSAEPVRVLVTVPLKDDLLARLRAASDRIEVVFHPARQPRDVPDEAWGTAQVLYTDTVVPEPEQAPHLRWIHSHWAGVDHLWDQPIVQTEHVLLTTSSGIHAPAVAEYVFMMMLAFAHRLPQAMALQARAEWPADPRAPLTPHLLRGSTVGIVGYGNIGREIARVAQTFGMEVLAVKRDVRQPADLDSYTLPGHGDPEGLYFHRLYPPEALVTMVRACDFVVLAVPFTESTRRMVNADVLAAMKPTAYLINVSRGGVVDEAALQDALERGVIAGAACDVFEAEPLPADSPLWKLPSLIITPHIAGSMPDYDERALQVFVENLQRYLARKDLLNLVDRTRGY